MPDYIDARSTPVVDSRGFKLVPQVGVDNMFGQGIQQMMANRRYGQARDDRMAAAQQQQMAEDQRQQEMQLAGMEAELLSTAPENMAATIDQMSESIDNPNVAQHFQQLKKDYALNQEGTMSQIRGRLRGSFPQMLKGPGFDSAKQQFSLKASMGEDIYQDDSGNQFTRNTKYNPNTDTSSEEWVGIGHPETPGKGLKLMSKKSIIAEQEAIAAEQKKAAEERGKLRGKAEGLGEFGTEIAEQEAEKARLTAQAKTQEKAASESFKQAKAIGMQLNKMDKAIDALNKGAKSGIIQKRLPSFKESTIQLEEAAKELGIEVINSATFGALSAPELQLALDTAMPLNLDENDLKTYLINKKAAVTKLKTSIEDAGIFLSQPGNTIDKWIESQRASQNVSDEDLINKYL